MTEQEPKFDRNALKKMIKERGYKQKVIAEKAGIKESKMSLILSEKRKCDVEDYVRICIALGVPMTTFIRYIENKTPCCNTTFCKDS